MSSPQPETGPVSVYPAVCLAIPVRNEASNLPALIHFIQSEHYPAITAIRVALAPSQDASEDILHHWAEQDSRVQVLENPEVTAAAGLNLCLYNAPPAEFFIRLDAHARYETGYLGRLVASALASGALNTGGIQQFRIENSVQFATAVVLTLVSDLGLNRWRNPHFSGYTDTVYMGCYRMDVLRNIGGFSEEQPTNQDAELNQRLNNIRRKAVFQDGSIAAWYAPRKTLEELARQYFHYGQGRAVNWITHWPVLPLRSILPPVLMAALAVLLVTRPVAAGVLFLLAAAAGYGLGRLYRPRFATAGSHVKAETLLLDVPVVLTLMLSCYTAGLVKRLWTEWRRGEG